MIYFPLSGEIFNMTSSIWDLDEWKSESHLSNTAHYPVITRSNVLLSNDVVSDSCGIILYYAARPPESFCA